MSGAIDLLSLEVDGSLWNPFAAGAVFLWAFILSCIAVIVASRKLPRLARIAALAAGATLAAETRIAQQAIGSALYSVASWRIIDVGFWDGPPVWLAPVTAAIVGVGLWAKHWRLNQPPRG